MKIAFSVALCSLWFVLDLRDFFVMTVRLTESIGSSSK